MKKIDFSNDKFAIIGLGLTGKSIVRYLTYKKAQLVRILDTRDSLATGLSVNVPIVFGALNYAHLSDVDVIVISPGVSIYEPALQRAIQNGKTVVGDIELFALEIANWKSKVIGITGSNGKTTVTTLTGYLSEKLGFNTLVAGNIGTPVLDTFLDANIKHEYPDVIVLELSSFQLETTYNLLLDSATVLNISEDHLDRYRDLLEYSYQKSNIFNHSKAQVLNFDDKIVCAMLRRNQVNEFFSEAASCKYQLIKSGFYYDLVIAGSVYCNSKELQLIGKHNYSNALFSLALLNEAGIEIKNAKDSLCQFAGLEHRMQKVFEYNDVIYVEDSKGTNVGAVIAGVGGLSNPVHLILGGDGKGQDFTPLADLVATKCKSVAIIGQDKELIYDVLQDTKVNVVKFDTLEEAVEFCHNNAVAGDAVVLSPACASWDMFKDYKHRANCFVGKIHEICTKK